MKKINLYTTSSKTAKEVGLPKEFSSEANMSLLSQAIHVYRARLHGRGAKVQTRGEVSLRKGKWYRQKGTGNARHGAKSAPIFVGGGKAHGPRAEKRVLTLPKKMRQKALASALSVAASNGKISLFEGNIKKTKDAQDLIKKVVEGEKSAKSKLTVILSGKNAQLKRFFKNLDNVQVIENKDLNAYQASFGGKLVFDNAIFDSEKKTKTKKS